MDGVLPLPTGVLPANRLQVPYVAEEGHDSDDATLQGYPHRVGVGSTEDAASLRPFFETNLALSSFMQSWLFFGLLRAFLCHPIRHADFILDGSVNLAQEVVENHFRRWKNELWKLPYAKKRRNYEATQKQIQYALAKSAVLEETADMFEQRDPEFERIALSVKLLAGLLLTVLEDTFPNSSGAFAPWALKSWRLAIRTLEWIIIPYANPGSTLRMEYVTTTSSTDLKYKLYGLDIMPPPLPPGDLKGSPSTRLLLRLLEENGSCPLRARQQCQTFDYLTLNSMAGLVKAQGADEDHRRCIEMKRCVAHDIIGLEQTVNYSFRHDPQECDGACDFIRIPHQQLAALISSGEKPIISVSIDGPLDLRLIPCTPYTTYTAISHVWSHGRGNPIENALPRCQVLWLRERIRRTYQVEHNPFYDGQSPARSEMEFEHTQTSRPGRPHVTVDRDRIQFWIDTLCIPVCPEADVNDVLKMLRFRAINQITPIFVGAYNTLVLDKGLETTVSTNPECLSGDEFACYVLGCAWMERGWTLQEGVLSHSIVLQLMDKPYQMVMALRRLLPPVNISDPPLTRAIVRIRRACVLRLQKELQEFRRHYMLEQWLPRARRIANMLQVPLFVWTWNSLIKRSTTRPMDSILIFASLLGFDVYQLRSVPPREMLMRVVQGCKELPLSLLYNSGPRVRIEGHPELSWIPEDVRGDELVTGPTIRKVELQRANSPVVYSFERAYRRTGTFLMLVTALGQSIPHTATQIHIVISAECSTDRASTGYILNRHGTTTGTQARSSGLGHVIVIDLACGSGAYRGIAGRGVCFSIVSRGDAQWTVQYDTPLVARSLEDVGTAVPSTCLVTERVAENQKIVMNYDASLWREQLSKRDPYVMYPFWAQIIGIFAWLMAFLLVMHTVGLVYRRLAKWRTGPLWYALLLYPFAIISTPVIIYYIYMPIRNRLSMFGYIAWLRTFDEPSEELTVHHVRWQRCLITARTRVRGLMMWALGRAGMVQNRYPDGMRDDALPGDIYLE